MSKSVIGALRVNLGLDSAQFERGAKRAQSSAQTLSSRLRVIAVAAAGVAAGLALAVRGQLNAADAMIKTADRIGMSVESLSQLEHAANLSGVSMQTFQGAMQRLARTATESASELHSLGISTRDSAGQMRPMESLLMDVADRLAKMPAGAERTALAIRLLGRQGAELIPMLQGGSAGLRAMMAEADALGLTLSTRTARAAEQFNDNLNRLGRQFTGIARMLMAELAPALVAITNGIVSAVARIREIGESIGGFRGYIVAAALALTGAMVPALYAAATATLAWAASFLTLRAALITSGVGVFIVGAGMALNWLIKLRESTGSWGAAIELLGEVAAGVWEGIKTSASSIAPALKGVWKSIVAEFEFAVSDLIHTWGRFLDLFSGSLSRLAETEILGARPFAAAEAAAQALVRAAGDAYRAAGDRDIAGNAADRAAAEAFGEAAATVTAGFDRAAEAGRRLRDAMSSTGDETVDTTGDIERLAGALRDTERAGGGARSGLDNAREGMSGLNDAAQQLGQSIQSSMEQGFMAIFDGTKKASDAFRDMARQILAELYRVLVVQRLVGTFQAGGGGILGALAGAFGGARADGGPVSAGRSYLVGERGPEMIVPRSDAHVIPNHALGGGPVNQVFHFNLAANGDESVRRIVAQAAPQIVEAAKTGVLDARRRGGAYRAAFG
jgi:hypothetical protein